MPPRPSKILTSVALFLAIGAASGIASALDESVVSTARALAQEAETDFKDGRYSDASAKFLRAYDAVRLPTLARSAARALVQQGKLVRASELYRQSLTLQPNELWLANLQQEAQTKAKQELEALLPRLPSLKIEVRGAPLNEVEISIDGAPVPNSLLGANQYADPGVRRLVAKWGVSVIEKSVELPEREQREVLLEFQVTPAPALGRHGVPPVAASETSKPSTARTLGWVGIGIGVTGLAVGVTAGVLTATKNSELSQDCPNGTCYSNRVSPSSLDAYHTTRTVSIVGFAAGAVGAAVGLTLLLTTPSSEKPSVGAWLGPNGVGVRGAF